MKENKLNRIVKSAYERVPIYNYLYNKKNIFNNEIGFNFRKDFNNLPVISKEIIKQYGVENIISVEYLDWLQTSTNLDGIHIEHTSGTTGEPMAIFWHNKDFYLSTIAHWHLRRDVGNIYPTSRCCSVIYDEINEYCKVDTYSLLLNRRKMTYNSAVRFLRKLNEFDPEWIYMPGSVIAYLVFVAKKEKLTFGKNIRYIEVATEPMIPYYRELIENYFGFKIYDMYGCQETNGIAYECSNGHLHVMSENVYVEILNDKNDPCGINEWGNVCVTGLHNTLMPIIRYKLNDLGRLSSIKCSCGNRNPIIELKSCRFPEIMMFDSTSLCPYGQLYYPLRRFSWFEYDKEVLFSIRLISSGKYRISFLKISWDALDKYKKLFLNIMHAYALDNLKFEFDVVVSFENTYRVGILKEL